ncbi:MAG: stalk domain-containing protein [Clostridiales bacterium]|nr:stalk domain-containing protein [Clostridiales bacterium]
MKHRIQGIVIGFVVASLVFGGGALALNGNRNIEVTYRDIKLFVEGTQLTPRDANNNIVEPFLYNGTVFLPVRAIGQAFGKDVEWAAQTSSVYIGGRTPGAPAGAPDKYLSEIPHTNFNKGWSQDSIYQINGTVTDHLGKSYTDGVVIYTSGDDSTHRVSGDADKANAIVTYPLNSQYWTLTGTISLPRDISITGLSRTLPMNTATVDVFFYGDGKLLHKALNVNSTYSHDFSIDVSNVNSLVIKVIGGTDNSSTSRHTALTNLGLYR